MRSNYTGQHAVVTGGAGFIGSHLADELLRIGMKVTIIDNLLTGTRKNIPLGVQFIEADVCIVKLPYMPTDYVFHLASPASPIDYAEYPIETLLVGSAGTLNMLNYAKSSGAKFILASTSEVYGCAEINPQPESYWGSVNSVGPRSMYDEAKRFAEAATMAYHDACGLDTRIARIFNSYGPRMRPTDGRVVSNFIRCAIEGLPVEITGDGSQTRSFCYVADTVDGLIKLALSDYHLPVNIGNPNEITIRTLAEKIMKLFDSVCQVRYLESRIDEPYNRRPDITIAKQVLGWEPKVNLADGLNKTYGWMKGELDVREKYQT
ncbi:MAG: NAD-dependent epimerase/dehydratase family protein [Dehalococcoidia bacterium]|jgi:dTDP-glucose 4,6-dehydratase